MMMSGWFRLSRCASVSLAAALLWTGAVPDAQAQVIAKSSRPAVAALATHGGVAAASDEGPIRGPMLGFLFNSTERTLRPMPGIPGASHIGDALPLGISPLALEVSADRNYALAIEEGTGVAYAIDLRTAAPSAQRINGVTAGANRIFLSPLGKSAALYFRATRQVEILTGLPEAPALKRRVDLSPVTGMPTAMAVSDDGAALAVAASQGDTGALFVATDGAPQLAGSLGQASQLAFLNESQDLLIADTRRSEVALVRNVATAPQMSVLASRQDGLEQPIAVGVTRDNRTAFAVSSLDHKVARMPLSGGAVEFIDCPCEPTSLQALGGGSVFRLTAPSSGPIFMLDARPQGDDVSALPRVLFVPAASGTTPVPEREARSPRGRVTR